MKDRGEGKDRVKKCKRKKGNKSETTVLLLLAFTGRTTMDFLT